MRRRPGLPPPTTPGLSFRAAFPRALGPLALATELAKLAVARFQAGVAAFGLVESLPHLRKLVPKTAHAKLVRRRGGLQASRCAPPLHAPAPDRAAFSRTSPADVISARCLRFPARLVPLPESRCQQQDPLSAGRAKIWCRQLHEGARLKVPCPVLGTNFFVPRVANAYENRFFVRPCRAFRPRLRIRVGNFVDAPVRPVAFAQVDGSPAGLFCRRLADVR